jgi:hypothetical protein
LNLAEATVLDLPAFALASNAELFDKGVFATGPRGPGGGGGFGPFGIPSEVHPNAVCGTLDAIESKFGIPVIYTSTVKDLATERAASWLSKQFTYWWLEQQGHGRVLIDSDGL